MRGVPREPPPTGMLTREEYVGIITDHGACSSPCSRCAWLIAHDDALRVACVVARAERDILKQRLDEIAGESEARDGL